MRETAKNDVDAGDVKASAAPTGARDAAAPVMLQRKKEQHGENCGGHDDDQKRKRKCGGAGERPRAERENGAKSPRFCRAICCAFATLMHPGGDLREENQRGEDEVDDEKKIPGDAVFREGIHHARAEGREAVEDDVAGDSGGVNQKQHGEGWAIEVIEMGELDVPRATREREQRESSGENRQADEGMREAAMV